MSLGKQTINVQPSPTAEEALSVGVASNYTGPESAVPRVGGDDGNPALRVSVEGSIRKGVDLTLDGKEGLFQAR